jgi:hypothetical protein
MTQQTEAPSGVGPLDAINEQQPSPPIIPPPAPHEAIKVELRNLAEMECDSLAEELALKAITTQSGVGIKVVRAVYAGIKNAYHTEKQSSFDATPAEPTPEELAEQEREEAAKQAEQAKIAEAVRVLQQTSNLHKTFHSDLQNVGFSCDDLLASCILLSHGARLLRRSSAFVFTGASGSGKTDGVNKGAQFLPPEMVLSITSFSDQYLYYLGNVAQKYLMFGEIAPRIDGEDDPKQTAMRQLISENKITRGTVEKTDGKTNDGAMKETTGPCVIVATTTKEPTTFIDELQNRATWIQSNDSAELTEKVLTARAKIAKTPTKASDPNHAFAVRAWQEFHRTHEPLQVAVPFADTIMPTGRHVTVRRLFNLILDYIWANALLHQHSRQIEIQNGERVVVATLDDYALAYRIATMYAPRVLEQCPAKARKVFDEKIKPTFDALKAAQKPALLNTGDLVRIAEEPESTVRRWLGFYVAADLLTLCDWKEGKKNTFRLNDDGGHVTQDLGLVHPARAAFSDVL